MTPIPTGIRHNWRQFLLLVLINAFVGGMVGLERTILPELADTTFHLAAHTAVFSFILVFGLVKAASNFFAGKLAASISRKKLLILGWAFALPVPWLLMWAPSWNWVVLANVFLGINQGFAWSILVIMKIDLSGERERGLAMGLNEFAGYLAGSLGAFLTGWIAAQYGLRPYPFYIGILFSVAGFLGSVFFVKDTYAHASQEAARSSLPKLENVFKETSWRHPNLGSVSQAGFFNNLNDGMVWGALPLLLASRQFTLTQIGIISAAYPLVWGIGQLITGKMSDTWCKKDLLFYGMMLQAGSILGFLWAGSFAANLLMAALLGWGTAMVYPTFLATIAENVHPSNRAESVGAFRLWRDLGYAAGAVLTGILADAFSLQVAVAAIAMLTFGSAMVIWQRMYCLEKAPGALPEKRIVLPFLGKIKTSGPACRKTGNSLNSIALSHSFPLGA